MTTYRKAYLLLAACWLIVEAAIPLRAAGTTRGVLFAKPFAGSNNDTLIEVYEFTSLVDHTGYYTVNPGPSEHQIGMARVIAVVSDDELTVRHITSEAGLTPLQTAQNRLESLGAGSAKMRAALADRLTAIKTEIANFKQGQVKIDGQWISAAEIKRLHEAEETAQQQTREETESRELVHALSRRDLTAAAYEQTMARLKTLRKADGPAVQGQAARFVNDTNATAKLKTEVRAFLQTAAGSPAMSALVTDREADQLHAPPVETIRTAAELQTRLATYARDLYYQTMAGELRPEEAALATLLHLSSEITKYVAGDLQSAVREIADDDPLPGPGAPGSGYPTLDAAAKNTHVLLAAAMQAFAQYCRRGQELEKLGNTADAIAEYQKATGIAKEPTILKKIQSLREQSLGL